MNNTQRKKLTNLFEELEGYVSTLETMGKEEQEKHDNVPCNLWNGQQCVDIQDNADALKKASETLQEWIDEWGATLLNV